MSTGIPSSLSSSGVDRAMTCYIIYHRQQQEQEQRSINLSIEMILLDARATSSSTTSTTSTTSSSSSSSCTDERFEGVSRMRVCLSVYIPTPAVLPAVLWVGGISFLLDSADGGRRESSSFCPPSGVGWHCHMMRHASSAHGMVCKVVETLPAPT
eukprot:gene30105-39301_t